MRDIWVYRPSCYDIFRIPKQKGIEKSARIHLEIVYFSVSWMLSETGKVYLVGRSPLVPQGRKLGDAPMGIPYRAHVVIDREGTKIEI